MTPSESGAHSEITPWIIAKGSITSGVVTRRVLVITAVVALFVAQAGFAAAAIALAKGRLAAQRYLCRRIVALLQRLGPTFIKVGQVLQTRRDVLPRMLCDELGVLQASVKPMSRPEARAALLDTYGAELHSIFAEIDEIPLASGSIACVYLARLRNGRQVAVKLQRPGIDRVVAADLAVVGKIGSWISRLPPLHNVPLREILSFLSDAIYGQLNFVREAASLKRLRDSMSSLPGVCVPRVEEEACRHRAVVMEFIPGLAVLTPQCCQNPRRRDYAAATLMATYRMIFVEGFVHCDMHPGNLYFSEGGRVVLLDTGFSVQLTSRIRQLFAEFFLNMGLGFGERCAEIVVESAAALAADANIENFTAGMVSLVRRSAGALATKFSLLDFAAEMFRLQRKCGLRANAEIIFPLLSLLVIEGTIRSLDPNIDFQRTAQPVLAQALFFM